jgi:hypothetical protein
MSKTNPWIWYKIRRWKRPERATGESGIALLARVDHRLT